MLSKTLISSVALFAVSAMAEEVVPVAKLYQEHTPAELAQLTIVERLKLYPWHVELMSLGFIAFTVILYLIGKRINDGKVTRFLESLKEQTLKNQFYQVGVTSKDLYVKDDGENYSSYATGRVNIESMYAKFKLQPRQNPFLWIMEFGMSFFLDSLATPSDFVDFTFTIDKEGSANYDNFIWAIVSKNGMNKFRTDNYFLSLTKTSESEKLPIEYVFMNEVPEMNELLLKPKFKELLPRCKKFLKFLAITDQPSEKPETIAETEPKKRVVLSIAIPSSKEEVAAATDLVEFVIEYVDFIVNKASFRPELTRRCKKTREAEVAKLKKLEEVARKELLDEKKAAEQKKLKAEISKLSPEEQRKLEKKQAERRQRRMMKNQKVRS